MESSIGNAREIYRKNNISFPPDTHTYMCVSGSSQEVKNVTFSR